MPDCTCVPNEFPFHCSRYNETMDHDSYRTCRGDNGILQKIKQDNELLKKLRANPCEHLGPEQATPLRRCALYGQCSTTFVDNNFQSCDVCTDHTAIAHLLELPTIMREHYVPFDMGKGSDSSEQPELGACCKPQTPPNCVTNDDCDCLERWILEDCEAEGGDFDAGVICIDENTSTPPCNCGGTECRFPG